MMVIIMLLLMGIWNYKNHTMQWERRRVDYSDSILYDNAQAVVFLALLIGTIAFSVPSISWRAIRDALRDRNKNEAAEVLGIREQSAAAKNTNFQKPSLPREHLLTEGFAQSQRTGHDHPYRRTAAGSKLFADSGRAPTLLAQHGLRSIQGYGLGHQCHHASKLPGEFASHPGAVGSLFASAHGCETSATGRKIVLEWDPVQHQHPLTGGLAYPSGIQPVRRSDSPAPGGYLYPRRSGAASYNVEAYIPRVTISQLRAASTEYPEYIRTRYLQLPSDLPARVHQLAQEITTGIDNPYDKAKAIESYLRANYPYDLEIPAPPADRDVTDYFLFDLKRGYCDYYATAMVVLARSSGLPARFVSGYSSGSYDALNAEYVIRELNAHSWAEIYFPEIGWIEFEPTASQPEIVRLEKEAELPVIKQPATQTEKFLFKLTNTGIVYWISPFGLALLMVVLYFTVLERIWILSQTPANAIAILYRRYYRMGRPLVGARTRAETASEFTSRLILNIEEKRGRSRRVKPPKSIKDDAQQLTNVYLLSLFSNHSIESKDASKAFDLWKRLRLQLWMARLKSHFSR